MEKKYILAGQAYQRWAVTEIWKNKLQAANPIICKDEKSKWEICNKAANSKRSLFMQLRAKPFTNNSINLVIKALLI